MYNDSLKKYVENKFAGIVDLAGHNYIDHLTRVSDEAYRMATLSISKSDLNIDLSVISEVGLLHDIIEDCVSENITEEQILSELRYIGVSETAITAILILTKRKDTSYDDYISRIARSKNMYSIIVKKCDLKDNMDITRFDDFEFSDNNIRRLKKYAKAYKLLSSIDI